MPLAPQSSMALVSGWTPPSGLVVLINAEETISYIMFPSLSMRGTITPTVYGGLDCELIDPPHFIYNGQEVRLYLDTVLLFLGTIRHMEAEPLPGSHLSVRISAQAQSPGPPINAPPTDAPWGLSDDPDGVINHGYHSLRLVMDTGTDGLTESGYEVVVREHGLWVNMTVAVESAAFNPFPEEFVIGDGTVHWLTPETPEYQLRLGDVRDRLVMLL